MQHKTGAAPGDADAGVGPETEDQFDPATTPIRASPSAEPEDGPADTATRGLTASVTALHARLDEIERSLIERIADVDDDRRRTAVLLQRARQGQDEAVAERLRQQANATRWAMLGLAAFVIIALALFYWQAAAERPLAAEQARPEGMVAADDLAPIQERLDGLAAAIAELADQPRPDAATAAEVARLTTALGRLGGDQQRLAGEIADLRERLAEPATGAAPQTDKPTSTPASATPPAAGEAAAPGATSAPMATGSGPDATAPIAGPDSRHSPNAAETAPTTAASLGKAAEPPSETPSPAIESEPRSTQDEDWAAPVPTSPPSVDAPSTGADIVRDLVRIADRPYAIQLVGYSDRDRLLAFATRYDLPETVFYREESYQGRPWFVVIHSLYPNYGDAMAARADLPPELLALEPLVRLLPAGTEIVRLDH